jgi:hypothetical protein
LAPLWESAWKERNGDKAFADLDACEHGDLSEYYDKKTNLTSYRLTQIKAHLKPLTQAVANDGLHRLAVHRERENGQV